MVSQKVGHNTNVGPIIEKPFKQNRGHICGTWSECLQCIFMKSWMFLNLGHVGSRTRSPGQIIDKLSGSSRGRLKTLAQ